MAECDLLYHMVELYHSADLRPPPLLLSAPYFPHSRSLTSLSYNFPPQLFHIWQTFDLQKYSKHLIYRSFLFFSVAARQARIPKMFLRVTVALLRRKLLLLCLIAPPPPLCLTFLGEKKEEAKPVLICMHSALVPAVNMGLKWKWEGGERVDYARQTRVLPPGWPTS